uniref:Serine/threonine-protein kinase RIO3 n=1 Tax=Fundulus heteroclitus TaxID=8078 RepID=A0A3Q2QK05_FUNHE
MDQSGVAAQTQKSPWGPAGPAAPACPLTEVMSEQLARQLEEENAAFPSLSDPAADLLLAEDGADTTSDLMLAQMLQMQFDREFDNQLRREEKKFNGDSKVSISFENYRMVHPYEDSDSSEDEVDWQDTRHDPYRADKPQAAPRRGFSGKGKNITTKHDEDACGRKNTARMDNFAPEVQVGDGLGLKLSNQVFNALKQHCYSEQRRSARLHDKKEHSTAEQAVDPRTRLLMYKMVNAGVLENISGCISTGKESVVFHADGGRMEEQPVPEEVVLKVFKTTLNEFKNRDRYIKDDYRFKDRFSKLNPRKVIRLWAEKEMHNLSRMKKAGIPCPDVVLLKKHILVMSFIGKQSVPAPKLKDVSLGAEEMKEAYHQVLQMMQQLYQDCNLVHADLSEYNMLWHQGKVRFCFLRRSLSGVSAHLSPPPPPGVANRRQPVGGAHPSPRPGVPLQRLQERFHGKGASKWPPRQPVLTPLTGSSGSLLQFFQKRGVSEAMSVYHLFNAVSGLDVPVGAEDEALFMAEVTDRGTHQGRCAGSTGATGATTSCV